MRNGLPTAPSRPCSRPQQATSNSSPPKAPATAGKTPRQSATPRGATSNSPPPRRPAPDPVRTILSGIGSLQPYQPPGPAPTAAPAAPPKLAPDPVADARRKADVMDAAAFASRMAEALSVEESIGANGTLIYLKRIRLAGADPADPIERMVTEQIVLGHQKVAQLHALAAKAGTDEICLMYTSAATRLLVALGQTVETLVQYRASLADLQRRRTGRREGAAAGSPLGAAAVSNTELGSNGATP